MWVYAEYQATTLFSLKPASATASGGKTLLVPTPFAIKMALLDVACRLEGQAAAAAAWNAWLGDLPVALNPSRRVVVNNTFIKVLKRRRNPAAPGSQNAGFFQQTITYREYAFLDGKFGIALQTDDDDQAAWLARWLVNVNYLGKRGSFIQIQAVPTRIDELPPDFIVIDGNVGAFSLGGVLTQLDDVGELSFNRASVFSGERITPGKHRLLRHVALPYRLVASSRSYSHYERDGATP
jgi:hypothetical protein